MKEKAKIRKAVYIAVMWCILASVLLGCRKSNVESYASAEEAKQAMSQCRTFLVEEIWMRSTRRGIPCGRENSRAVKRNRYSQYEMDGIGRWKNLVLDEICD